MIKFDKGLVEISGKGIDILAEYAVITYRIKEMFMKDGGKEEEVNEQLREVFERGLLSEEELDKKFMEAVGEAMKKPELAGMLVGAAFAALFGQNDKEDNHGRN